VSDYREVLAAMQGALRRFATGTYVVWYPQLARLEAERLPGKLLELAGGDWLHVWLRVHAPAAGGFGLHGSGVFVFNPPWDLEVPVRAVMPFLAATLAQDEAAAFDVAYRQT